MKRKTSVSHDEAMIRRIRKDPQFAAEYLKGLLGSRERACTEPCRLAATLVCPRYTPLPKQSA